MKNLKKLQQKEQRISLKRFLGKMSSLEEFLYKSNILSQETRDNIKWYCNYRVQQFYKKYSNQLKWEQTFEKQS